MAKRANRSSKGCRTRGFVTKGSKCFFEEREISYLGLIVGNGIIKTDPKKIEAVKEWAIPRTKKELQAFIEFLNYCQQFIKDFSKIARPLHLLTGNKL